MPFGQSYSFFNFLANGYAIIGYPIAHNRDDAKKNMIISMLQIYALYAEYQNDTSNSLMRKLKQSRILQQ